LFRGREITHPEIGRDLLQRVANKLVEEEKAATMEKHISMEGRFMTMILAPVVAKAPAKPKEPRAPRPQAEQAENATEPEETQMAAALKAAGATAE